MVNIQYSNPVSALFFKSFPLILSHFENMYKVSFLEDLLFLSEYMFMAQKIVTCALCFFGDEKNKSSN